MLVLDPLVGEEVVNPKRARGSFFNDRVAANWEVVPLAVELSFKKTLRESSATAATSQGVQGN